jgi:hypothetical protein
MKNTADSDGIGEESRRLSHAPIIIDSFKAPGVQEGIPVRHVDHGFVQLRPRVFELGKESSRPEIMVILIDLPQRVTDFQVPLIVISPMFLAAIYRYSAIWALEIHMRRAELAGLSGRNTVTAL